MESKKASLPGSGSNPFSDCLNRWIYWLYHWNVCFQTQNQTSKLCDWHATDSYPSARSFVFFVKTAS